VFCNRKRDVGTLHRSLQRHGFKATALHGDLDQRARMAALDSFKNGDMDLLIASDVAARGLDIPDVSHVFNFDVPIHAEDYVHRIGRTGRAGRSGKAVTLVAPADKRYLNAIESLTGQHVSWAGEPVSEESGESHQPHRRGGRRNGRGSSSERERGAASQKADRAPQAARPSERRSSDRHQADRSHAERGHAPEQRRAAAAPPQRREARHDRGRDRDRDDLPVLGLGDHVPQFLLRPVQFGKG
jgi:superfamily II DNA/RNA helicase